MGSTTISAGPAAGATGTGTHGGRGGRYLAPDVPETLALVTAAGTVLIACGRAEDHARPRRGPPGGPDDSDPAGTGEGWACVDPLAAFEACQAQLPSPVAGKAAFAALHRVVTALRPALHRHPEPALPVWWGPDGNRVAPLRLVAPGDGDLQVLAAAAACLTHPTPALATVLDRLCPGLQDTDDGGHDDRHPAALGCLLAVLVPVADPDTELLAVYAQGDGEGDGVRLDARGRAAHRRVTTRMTTALAACR
jgi:hypothetical protein